MTENKSQAMEVEEEEEENVESELMEMYHPGECQKLERTLAEVFYDQTKRPPKVYVHPADGIISSRILPDESNLVRHSCSLSSHVFHLPTVEEIQKEFNHGELIYSGNIALGRIPALKE